MIIKMVDLIKKVIKFVKGKLSSKTINLDNSRVHDQSITTNIQINGPSINQINIPQPPQQKVNSEQLALAIRNRNSFLKNINFIYWMLLCGLFILILKSGSEDFTKSATMVEISIYILITVEILNILISKIFLFKELKIQIIIALILEIITLCLFKVQIQPNIALYHKLSVLLFIFSIFLAFSKEVGFTNFFSYRYYNLAQNKEILDVRLDMLLVKFIYIIFASLPLVTMYALINLDSIIKHLFG